MCGVFFDVAYLSFLPTLVGRERLVEGNSKLEVSRSSVGVVGPGIAGMLVGLVTAPIAITLDALSFFVSAASLWTIRAHEPPLVMVERRSLWSEMGEGLRVVLGNPLLRAIAGCTGTFTLFSSMWGTVFLLRYTQELGIGPLLLGVVFGAGSAGNLCGATLAPRTARWFGFGRTIIGSAALLGGSLLLPAVAGGPFVVAVATIVAAHVLNGLGVPIYNINQLSLRQAITAPELQGRVNATHRFIAWGIMPIGALIGGALGERIGLQATMVVGALGTFLAVLWPLCSPVRTLRTAPA